LQVAAVGKLQPFQQLLRRLVQRFLLSQDAPERIAIAGRPEQAAADVLEHGHARKDRRDLEAARQPDPVDFLRRQIGGRLSIDRDLSRGNRKTSRDQVEQRGLAGAVGADDGMAFPFGNAEIDAADDFGASKILAHVAQLDGWQGNATAPFSLTLSITSSQRSRKPRAAIRSHSQPRMRAASATTQGIGAGVSMRWPPILNVLPCAAPMVVKEASSTISTKPSMTSSAGGNAFA